MSNKKIAMHFLVTQLCSTIQSQMLFEPQDHFPVLHFLKCMNISSTLAGLLYDSRRCKLVSFTISDKANQL